MTKAKTTQQALTVERRPAIGTRPARRLRAQGLIPGVVYGRNMESVPVSVNARELVKLLHSKMGEHALVTLHLKDTAPWEKPVLVKSLQYDPVDDHVVHIDFHAVLLTERLRVKVPVLLRGEAVGVKQEGGILEHFLREIEVACLPTAIPAQVEHDISAMKIGDTLHVRDLAAPAGAKILEDAEGVIASVQAPREEKPEEAAAETVAEPEVLREKKPEAEAAAEGGKGEKAEKAEEKEKKEK